MLFRANHLTIVFTITLLLSACGGVEDRKEKYFEQAETSFQAQDYDKAKLGFKNVIQIDPKDIRARIGLAKVLVATQDWRGAAGQYKGALDLDPNYREVQIELGKLYLLARATDLSLELADQVLLIHPNDVDGLTLKAGGLAQQQKMNEALAILSDVNKLNPDHLDSALLYATFLSTQNKHDEALKVLSAARKSSPEDIGLITLSAKIQSADGKHDEAISNLREIIALKPSEFLHTKKLAMYLSGLKKNEEAEQVILTFINDYPEDMKPRQSLIDMYMSQKNIDKAETKLTEFIAKFDEEYSFQMGLARLKLAQSDIEAAIKILEKIVKSDPVGPAGVDARIERAKIHIALKEIDQAKTVLDEVISENPNSSDALMLRGRIAYTENRSIDAINDFRTVLKDDPDSPVVIRALADSHSQNREYTLAENYYKRLITRNPQDLSATNALAGVMAANGDFQGAIKLRENIFNLIEDDANNIELAKLYVNSNDVSGLVRVVSKLLDKNETKASGHYFKGLQFQSEQKHEEALGEFDSALLLTPNAIEPLSAKIKSYLILKKATEAKNWLSYFIKLNNKNAIAHNLLGEIYLTEDKLVDAEKQFQLAKEISEKWHVPYRNLALMYRKDKQDKKAVDILKEGIDKVIEPLKLRSELSLLLELSGDINGAIEQYETMFNADKNDKTVANNLAMLLVTYKEDSKSIEQAVKVAEILRGTDNPLYLDTLGWVYYKQQQPELALPLIKRAVEKAPQVAQIHYHLGMTYYLKNDFAAAKTSLLKALESEQDFVGKDHAEQTLSKLNNQS